MNDKPVRAPVASSATLQESLEDPRFQEALDGFFEKLAAAADQVGRGEMPELQTVKDAVQLVLDAVEERAESLPGFTAQ